MFLENRIAYYLYYEHRNASADVSWCGFGEGFLARKGLLHFHVLTVGDNKDTERQYELREALRSINSTIGKCEKTISKLNEGTSKHTLTKRRIEAFRIAVSLIEKELREENNDVAMP